MAVLTELEAPLLVVMVPLRTILMCSANYAKSKEKLDVERAGGGKHPWYEIFTGPRMAYRTLLGITL
jgi:hypothetical protein